MKRLYICALLLALALPAHALAVTTGFDCEVSDTSPENTWNTWNLFQGESRYLQVNYLQNGEVIPLTNAGISGVSLSLKASDSTNVYLLAGEVYVPTNGSIRVLWSSTNVVPVALYNAEFLVPDVLEINMAARGKIKVIASNGDVTTATPYWPTPVTKIIAGDNVTISPPSGVGNVTINASASSSTSTVVKAGTGISVSTNGVTNIVALNSASQSSLLLADSALQNGDNVSELVNDAGYGVGDAVLASPNTFTATNAFPQLDIGDALTVADYSSFGTRGMIVSRDSGKELVLSNDSGGNNLSSGLRLDDQDNGGSVYLKSASDMEIWVNATNGTVKAILIDTAGVISTANDIDVTGDASATGDISGTTPLTLDTSATVVLTAAECKGTIRFNNDDDVIDYTLPDAVAGMVVTIANTIYDQVITVDPQDGDAIIFNDRTVNTTGNAVDSSGADDDSATFVAISGTQWLMYSAGNAWTDGGAD